MKWYAARSGKKQRIHTLEFTKPGRQRQPERHLKFCKASIVSLRYLSCIIQKAKMRPSITQRCMKTIGCSLKKNIEKD